jgi:hypothetical protein
VRPDDVDQTGADDDTRECPGDPGQRFSDLLLRVAGPLKTTKAPITAQ